MSVPKVVQLLAIEMLHAIWKVRIPMTMLFGACSMAHHVDVAYTCLLTGTGSIICLSVEESRRLRKQLEPLLILPLSPVQSIFNPLCQSGPKSQTVFMSGLPPLPCLSHPCRSYLTFFSIIGLFIIPCVGLCPVTGYNAPESAGVLIGLTALALLTTLVLGSLLGEPEVCSRAYL